MNLVTSNLRQEASSLGTRAGVARQPDAERAPLIREYLRIAFRWRYVIIGVTAACILLGLIATLMMTPKYTAVATVEISREANKVTDLQGVEREAGVSDQEFYQTQYGLLKSRSLSERVATQLRLVDDPKFFEMFGVSSNDPSFKVVNGRYPVAGRVNRQRVAGEVLRQHLDVSPTRLSRLVDIGITSPSPEFSAKVANAWAESFIQTNLERKVQATSYGRDLLQKQLAQLKERLDASQRQLVAYASSEKIINLPSQAGDGKTTSERPIIVDELAALNEALAKATTERIQAQSRYEQSGRSGASSEALVNPAINGMRQKRAEIAAEYQRLMTQFEPEYPAAKAVKSQLDQLDRSLAREEGRVTGSVLGDYRAALERERALQARVEQVKASYLDVRRRSIQYNIYQQEVDTSSSMTACCSASRKSALPAASA